MFVTRIRSLRLLGIVALLIFAVSAAMAAELTPPIAKVIPKIDTSFGDIRVDNYYWMRDRENPDVLAYIEAENAYTDAVMAHAEGDIEKLYQEIKGRIKETDLSVPAKHGDYFYYQRQEEGKQYDIYCRKQGSLEAPEEILLDANILAMGREFMDIGAFEVSPDHKLLAFGLDDKGSERYTIRVKDIASGDLYPDAIELTAGDVVWANDSKTLFYTKVDDAWRPYQLYRHTLGTDPTQDVMVYQEDDDRFWVSIRRTKSNAYLLLNTSSEITSEWRYLDANDPNGEFKTIRPREQGIEYSVDHRGDRFYIWTNEKAVNFKVMTAPVSDPGKANWTELIAHRPDVKIDAVEMFDGFMVVYERKNGLQAIRITDLTTNESHDVVFPEPVYSYRGAENPEFVTGLLRFNYVSLVTPNTVYDYDMKTRQWNLLKRREVLGGYNPDEYQSERLFATARDGAKVPISIVYKKGLVKNGENPLYLDAYGAYGVSEDPWFSSNRISLLNRGFVWAIAHVRGGGEMGRPWYEDGKLLKKKNTFYDFIDCAKYLVKQKFTKPEKTVIYGASAGGLLIGAVVNMAPQQFGVAIAGVPFVDMMNTMLDETIPLTVIEYEEWGNPNVEKYYRYMRSYSPYDNVTKQAYPHLLIESSLNDTRVSYWEGTKWAAKLRILDTSPNRLLLKTNMGAGHGGASGRYDALREVAFEYAFILDCLGMLK
jgi:oligopeptidase B